MLDSQPISLRHSFLLAVILCVATGCGGGSASPAVQPTPGAALPAFPAGDHGPYTPTRKTSDNTLAVTVNSPAATAGAHDRVDGTSYVVAAAPHQLAWAQFSLASVTTERPLTLRLSTAAAPLQAGGANLPLQYWVAVADYTLFRWEWAGPFTADTAITLYTSDPLANPAKRDRYVSASGTFNFIVTAGLDGSSGAAVALTAANLDTTSTAAPLLPHFPVLTAVTPGTGQITVTWQHVAPLDPSDAVDTAQQYTVFRRGPFDRDFVVVGTVPGPNDTFVDPADAAAGTEPPVPGGSYSYKLAATDTAGETPTCSAQSTTLTRDPASITWDNSHADYTRCGYIPSASVAATLTADWSNPLNEAASTSFRREPVVDAAANIDIVDRHAVRQFASADGSEPTGPFGSLDIDWVAQPSLWGDNLAYTRQDNGIQVVKVSAPGLTSNYDGLSRASAAPLLLGNHLLWADEGGIVNLLDTTTNTFDWQYGSNPSGQYKMDPATDLEYVYVCKDNGLVEKLDLASGTLAGSLTLTDIPLGETLALDLPRHRLYMVTNNAALLAIDTDTMTIDHSWTYPAHAGGAISPCVLWNTTPPLVVTAYSYTNPSNSQRSTIVKAIDASTLADAWETSLDADQPYALSACSNRIMVLKSSAQTGGPRMDLALLDLAGSFSQAVPFTGEYRSCAVPVNGKALVVSGGDTPKIDAFKEAVLTPPTWDDPNEVGVIDIQQSLTAGEYNDLLPRWGSATDPGHLPVHYVIFCSQGQPPQFTAPFTHTTVIPNLVIQDSNSYHITGLTTGTPYYISVRAYTGVWGPGAAMTLDTNFATATPPWRPLGIAPGGVSLLSDVPLGSMVVAQTTTPGHPNIVISNYANHKLANIYGDTGNPGLENAFLNSFKPDGYGAAWDQTTYIASAQSGVMHILKRNQTDDWNFATVLSGVTPDVNPAVALTMSSGKGAVGYSEFVSGTAPATIVNYYAVRFNGTTWGSKEAIDTSNLGGRDIATALDPADGSKPWFAYQRGTEAATGMAGCTKGQLWFARGDGAGSYALELVDAGANGADSDCGKRVTMVLDSSNHPQLAYLDLNAANTEPRGQLKYAYFDGAAWHVEVVKTFDLSLQTGESQHTYSNVGLMLDAAGRPVISFLERKGYNTDVSTPYAVNAWCITRTAANTYLSELAQVGGLVYAKDREPCSILLDSFGWWELLYVSGPASDTTLVGRQIHRLVRMQ